jgi:hypothetical protein
MKIRSIALSLGMMLVAGTAQAQTMKDLIGCWSLQSIVIEKSGQKLEPFGPNPIGQLTFTSDGHMSVIQMRSDLPEKASGEPTDKIVGTFIAYFGTYELQGKTVTLKVEGSTRSDWRNKTFNRTLERISASELVWADKPDKDMTARLVAKRCSTAT